MSTASTPTESTGHRGTYYFQGDRFHPCCSCGATIGEPARFPNQAKAAVDAHLAEHGVDALPAIETRRSYNRRRYTKWAS